ncbi:Fructokinase [subsurface metagenome]
MNCNYKVAGLGELLWDVLPQGKQLGGAPCNFAFHALQTGCDAYIVSAIGTDIEGEEILRVLNQLKLKADFIQTMSGYPTGMVTVKLNDSGIPNYTIHENAAWDNIEFPDGIIPLAREMDAVCFGSLAQRNDVSRNTILQFLEITKSECLRVFDINLRQSFYNQEIIEKSLELANVLKLNDDELLIVSEYFGCQGDEESRLKQLADDFQLMLIAFTKGSKGSLLFTKTEKSYCEVPTIRVADTVGAGDSFTAILISGMLNKMKLEEIHSAATNVAAFVCTMHGATPKLPEHLLNQIDSRI